MSEGLPKGWNLTDLENLCTIETGKKDVNEGNPNGKYPFFTCAQEVHKIDNYVFDGKALLIAGNGFFNVKHYEGKFDAYQRTYVLQNFKINDRYLYWYIQFRIEIITKDNRGSTIKYIRLGDLANHQVFIPPLNEQKRIVAKLDAIMPRIEAVKKRMNKMPTILKRFRQSVLTAAVTGRLTEQWRKAHPEVESAEVLLEKVFKEKINLHKQKKIAKPKQTKPITEEDIAYPVPLNWKWCRLSEIALKMSTGPFGTMLHKADYIENGIPVINPTNIKHDKLIASDKMMISKAKYTELSRYSLKEGNIVLARRGDLGKCGIVTKNEVDWLCGTGSFFLEIATDPTYFRFFYVSDYCQAPLNADSIGSTMLNLNQTVLSNVPFPLPPLEEQKEIVRQVDKLFALADKVEGHYQNAKAKIDKLSQSVLAKAFRGELVPQDPSDEPAEKLLERILEEKAKMEAELKGARKKVKKRTVKKKSGSKK